RRIEHGHREVLALARLLGIGRLVHGGADLDGNRLERAPDDAERDRIGSCHGLTLTMRLAEWAPGAITPRGTPGRGSRSPTMAGPRGRAARAGREPRAPG